MGVYITGDTHGDFRKEIFFSNTMDLSDEDVIIVAGDAGLNYYVEYNKENSIYYDTNNSLNLKGFLSRQTKNIFLMIHGNHEARPYTMSGYKTKIWNGGIVYYQEEFPKLLFAKDGEIYTFNDRKVLIIGGAYSVDKHYRLAAGANWFSDEQPDDKIKENVLESLKTNDYKVDYVITHTCPFKYMPTEKFIKSIDQSTVDHSTEHFLDAVEEQTKYCTWFCGHYHTDKIVNNIHFLYHKITMIDTKNRKK